MTEIQKKPKKILVPDFYRICCKVLEAYLNCEGKVPQLLNVMTNNNPRRSRGACQFLLLLSSNISIIKTVVENVELFNKFQKLSPLMAYVIVGDLLFKEPMSERFKNLSYPVTSVLSMEEELREEFTKQGGLGKCKEQSFGTSPRWVFVNSLHTTIDEVKDTLVENGYYQMIPPEKTYDSFLDSVKTLGPGQYIEDFHLPGLLALPSRANVKHSHLFAEQKILLQDKASCLPPLVSGVVPGMTVVDACAAPGNKTILLANLLKGKGRLMAIDKDDERFSLLKTRLSDHGVKNVRCINSNFTDVSHADLQGAQVVLVDPSCSNSGVSMHTNDRSLTTERIRNLACMQIKLLSHALTIPGVQTVVYSTCSVHYEENEGVVEEAMLKFGRRFELEDLGQHIGQWKHFGMEKSPFGGKVLRTNPEVDLCHGFFVAKFVAKTDVEDIADSTDVNEFQEEWNENDQCSPPEDVVVSHSYPVVVDTSSEYSKANNKPKCDSQLYETCESSPKEIVSKSNRNVNNLVNNSSACKLDGKHDGNENTAVKKLKNKCKETLTDDLEDVKPKKKKGNLPEKIFSEDQVDGDSYSEGITKKKKKHVSDDCTDNFEEKNCENCSQNNDSSKNDRKQAKRRKKEISVDCSFVNEVKPKKKKGNLTETPLSEDLVDGDCNDSITKKKKKKEHVLDDCTDNFVRKKDKRRKKEVSVDRSFVDEVENDHSKMRKERKSRKDGTEEELSVSGIYHYVHGEKDTQVKETKNASLVENVSASNGLNCVQIKNCDTRKHKKKRKKSSLEIDANEADVTEGESTDCRKEKKMRSRDLQQIASVVDSVDIAEGGISKKKKKGKYLQDTFEENGNDTESEISETRKEKKKKKKNHQKERTADDDVDVARLSETKREKKRKRDLQECASAVDETVVVVDDNREMKKKKKRNKESLA